MSGLLSRFIVRSKASLRVSSRGWAASLHTDVPLLKEEKKENAVSSPVVNAPPVQTMLGKYGLDDYKIAGPIGLAAIIPALSNNVYVLNEESQLACCFLLFCTSVYKFGGEAIGSYFDARSNAILAQHNAIEDANIKMAKEALEAHRNSLEIFENVTALEKVHKEVVKLLCEVESQKLRHEMRDIFVKNLETIATYETAYQGKLQMKMVEYATNEVNNEVLRGGKSIKDSAFKNALSVLSHDAVKATEEDEIAKLFGKHLRAYAVDLESQKGTKIDLTPAQVEDLQADLDAFMKRANMELADLKAPKQITFDLIQ